MIGFRWEQGDKDTSGAIRRRVHREAARTRREWGEGSGEACGGRGDGEGWCEEVRMCRATKVDWEADELEIGRLAVMLSSKINQLEKEKKEA